MAISIGGSSWLGTKRHAFTLGEQVEFSLTKPDGTPYTNGTIGAGLSETIRTTEVKAVVLLPTGATHNLHDSPPGLAMRHLGDGVYALTLWGEGSVSPHEVCLSSVGDYGLKVLPVAAEFNPFCGQYAVRAEWDVQCAVTYIPGASGSDQIAGLISIHRWWNHAQLFKPLTATGAPNGRLSVINTLAVTISDASGTIATFTHASGDFSEGADGNIYWAKAVMGITGARSLTARVTFTYVTAVSGGVQMDSYAKDFPIVAPMAA